MKILILVDTMIQGGFQRVALMEAISMRNLGHDVTLAAIRRTDDIGYQDLMRENDIELVFLDNSLPSILKFSFKFPYFEFFSFFHLSYGLFLPRIIARMDKDLVIVHGTYTAFSTILIHLFSKSKVFVFIHDAISYIITTRYQKSALKKLFPIIMPLSKLGDRLLVSTSSKVIAYPPMTEYLKKIHDKPNTYLPIYSGVEINPYHESWGTRENYVIAFTRWDRNKNLEMLLEIWKDNPDLPELKIVGKFIPESYGDQIAGLLKKYKLEKRVIVKGFISETEVGKFLQKAKFLVHPCKEGFGMTIIEAMSYGCLPIHTNNSGVAGLVMSKKLKFFQVKEGDVKDYTQKIRKASNLTAVELFDFSKIVYQTAKNYSWEKHSEIILECFKQNQ